MSKKDSSVVKKPVKKGKASKGYMNRRPSAVMLSRIEAASRLGVSPMTLIRMEKAGRLPRLKLGKNLVRYRVEDLAKLEQEALV